MRYLFGFLCVCALGVMPLVGCSETTGDGGSGGSAGSGGTAGNGGSGGGIAACVDNVCPCTEAGIRAAIQAGGADPYTFDCGGPETVVTTEGIVIDNDVILDGESNLTVDGSESYIVFSVGVVTAELRGLTVTGGGWDSGGKLGNGGEPIPASIGNSGMLTITNSTVSAENEIATIVNGATLTITNSTVSWTDGGGINSGNEGSTLTITNSTLSGGQGDGIDEAILIYGTLTVTNSTVVGNIYGEGTVTNSLIDGECAGAMTSNGYNIESPGDTCGFDQTGDQSDVTAEQLNLGPLSDNSGPTMTHKPGDGGLREGSVAIDKIPEADCEVETDQRGQLRPAGPDPKRCDVGAVEVQGPIKSGLWLGGNPASNTDGTPFDTGWAICFNVNEDGTALTTSTDCDIDGNDDEAYMLEVSWKNDVGAGTVQGEVGICNANPEEGSESIGIGDSYPFEDAFGVGAVGVPIEDSSFAIPLGFLFPDVEITGGEIQGTFNGDTASGTATWTWAPGMGYSQCELDGGWTAAPAP